MCAGPAPGYLLCCMYQLLDSNGLQKFVPCRDTTDPGTGLRHREKKKKKMKKKSGDQSSPLTSRSGHPVCAGLCQDIYIAIAELDSNGFRLRHQIPCRAKIYRTQALRKKTKSGTNVNLTPRILRPTLDRHRWIAIGMSKAEPFKNPAL